MTPAAPAFPLHAIRARAFGYSFGISQANNLRYVPIVSASAAAPCVLATSAPHGLPADWLYHIRGARGLTRLNTLGPIIARAPSATTLEINSLDARNEPAYEADSGVIVYAAPQDLSGYSAELTLYGPDDADTPVLTLTVGNGLTLDETAHRIAVALTPEQLTLDFPVGGYALYATPPGDGIQRIVHGDFYLSRP